MDARWCESTALPFLLGELPRPLSSCREAPAGAAAVAELSPSCVEEESRPPPCGEAGSEAGREGGGGRRRGQRSRVSSARAATSAAP